MTDGLGAHPRLTALLVEDDPLIADTIAETLTEWGAEVRRASSVKAALLQLATPPSLVVLDVRLPDGSGISVADKALRRHPTPLILAISGNATAKEAFQLAELGVRGYLPKPLSLSDFTATIEALLASASQFVPQLVANVGHETYHEILTRVRYAMAAQALALAHGSRSGAARVLGVTRQAVQQLIRDLDIDEYKQY